MVFEFTPATPRSHPDTARARCSRTTPKVMKAYHAGGGPLAGCGCGQERRIRHSGQVQRRRRSPEAHRPRLRCGLPDADPQARLPASRHPRLRPGGAVRRGRQLHWPPCSTRPRPSSRWTSTARSRKTPRRPHWSCAGRVCIVVFVLIAILIAPQLGRPGVRRHLHVHPGVPGLHLARASWPSSCSACSCTARRASAGTVGLLLNPILYGTLKVTAPADRVPRPHGHLLRRRAGRAGHHDAPQAAAEAGRSPGERVHGHAGGPRARSSSAASWWS